jgi:hypothetical protein
MRTLRSFTFKNGVSEKTKALLVARANRHTRVSITASHSRPSCVSGRFALSSLLAAIRDLDDLQFNTTSTYLHGALKEGPYMEQPEGNAAPGREIGSGDSRRVSMD